MLWQLKKDLKTWQTLQETTTKLLGVSLLLIDSQGEPVTEITNACLFCEAVRSKEVCLHSDRRAATRCIQQKKSHFIYRCPYQFVNIVFPIYVDGRHVGALFIGQLKQQNQQNYTLIPSVAATQKKEVEKFTPQLIQFYHQHPLSEYEKITLLVRHGESIVQLITTQLEDKIKLGEYQAAFVDALPPVNELNVTLIDRATAILNDHPGKVYRLSELAQELNCSISTLKKLFQRNLNLSFSAYYTQLKIANTKKLLAFTNETTCSIAEKLGYTNPSVLYKKFKRETGQTMSEYRTSRNAEFHAEKSRRTIQ